ncbi:TPA: hypothetical protein ACGFAI_002935 [Escherichia coli]
MAITPLQREIMIRLANPKLNVSVQHSNLSSEPKYRVDEAIRQLHLQGFILACQSQAESGDWLANGLTSKGKIFLEEIGDI